MDTYPTFIGIFGEINYYGGNCQKWLEFKSKNQNSTIEDFRDDLKKNFLKNKGVAK